MRHAILVAAVSGFSSPVLGQLSVHLSFDATDAAMGEIVTASLTASSNAVFAGNYLQQVSVDLLASTQDVYEVVDVAPVAWNNPVLGFDGQGVPSGADVLGIFASQFSLIPPIDNSNPILITTFTLRRIGTGSLTYTAGVPDGVPYAFFWPDWPHDPPIGYGPEVFTSDTLLGTPSPGVLGVIGAGGVLAARRRR